MAWKVKKIDIDGGRQLNIYMSDKEFNMTDAELRYLQQPSYYTLPVDEWLKSETTLEFYQELDSLLLGNMLYSGVLNDEDIGKLFDKQFTGRIFENVNSNYKDLKFTLNKSDGSLLDTSKSPSFQIILNLQTEERTESGRINYPILKSFVFIYKNKGVYKSSNFVLSDGTPYGESNHARLSNNNLNKIYIDDLINSEFIPIYDPTDPYNPIDPSGPSPFDPGSGGNFDNDSDTIDIPPLPSISASSCGFITLYNPTLTQVQQLANYMWSDDIIDVIKKFFGNPQDAIIGLSILPCNIPSSGMQEVNIANIPTGVRMLKVSNQFVDVDCGELFIDEYYGSALDYSPHTKVEVYLPFIGVRPLDTDEVMKSSIRVRYRIDVLSGGLICYVLIKGNVMYQYNGNCAIQIPVTSQNFGQIISASVSMATAIGATVASGGSLLPMAATGLANIAMSSKPNIEKSGGLSGGDAMLGVMTPYLILKRPKILKPTNYYSLKGLPCQIGGSISSFSGFTKFDSVKLSGFTATDSEVTEITQLLKEGVTL